MTAEIILSFPWQNSCLQADASTRPYHFSSLPSLMNAAETAREILDTLLGHLGYTPTIEIEAAEAGPVLQVSLELAMSALNKKRPRVPITRQFILKTT